MATMRPGVGAAKAIFRGRAAVLLKTVMKSDSPASMRLPALSTAPTTPACAPAPTAVVIAIPSSMYIMLPGLGHRGHAGRQLELDELHLGAVDLEWDRGHVADRRRGRRHLGGAAAGQIGEVLRDVDPTVQALVALDLGRAAFRARPGGHLESLTGGFVHK